MINLESVRARRRITSCQAFLLLAHNCEAKQARTCLYSGGEHLLACFLFRWTLFNLWGEPLSTGNFKKIYTY